MSSLLLPIIVAVFTIISYFFFTWYQAKTKHEQEELIKQQQQKEKEAEDEKQKHRKPAKKDITATNRRTSDATKPKEEEHKEMVLQLKGHQARVTDFAFSASGKHAATASEDGTLRIWTLVDLVTRNIPFVTIKCKFDYATAIAISGDARYLVAAMNQTKELHIYELTHDATSHRITHDLVRTIKTKYSDVITSLALTTDGAAVVTCAEGQDTQCYVYGVRGSAAGQLIHIITTAQIINYRVSGSGDGKFVGFTTKLSDVKIYELTRKKASPTEVAAVELVMTLKGHKRAVKSVAFGPGNELCATASIDGSWRTFGINVRYGQAEDPKLKHLEQTEFAALELIALSPNPKQSVLAVTSDTTLAFYHSLTGAHLSTIPHVHRHAVSHLAFHPTGTHIATSSNQNNTVNLFKVPTV